MSVVKYVSASRDQSCLLQAYGFDKVVEKLKEKGIEISLDVRSEPRTSLAQTYNDVLNAVDASKYDWIVFVHSDAAMDVESFTTRLVSFNGKYDVVGVAGAKQIELSASPLSWFTASKHNPTGRFGMVMHVGSVGTKQPPMPAVYTPSTVTATDDYMAAIDGVCIAVNRKVVENKDCRFDERFPFDFYDLDFSLTVNSLGLSLGAMSEKTFVHLSVGKGILKPEYETIEKTFREKWDIRK